MKRKDFLKKGIAALGVVAVAPIVACKKDNMGSGVDNTVAGGCNVAPSETKGPFPTKNPSSFQIMNIKGDRTGTSLTIKLTIQNKNNNCTPISGAFVDVWHCDKDGNYSEYGSLTSDHFLRGRQTSDNNGVVAFDSIYPGWYPGRAPHIHVEVFNASGKSLVVTQIAFPTEVSDTVYTTATNLYTKGKQGTSNRADGIFSDSLNAELATITGSISAGYVLTQTIVVNA